MNRGDVPAQVRKLNLTYLSETRLQRLVAAIDQVNGAHIEGCFIEAGCALGGSLIVQAAFGESRTIQVFDTFEMIPAPGPRDPVEVHERYAVIKDGKSCGIGEDIYYGYRSNLLEFVRAQVVNCLGSEALSRIVFHKGILEETMRIDAPVAFAHVDVDWFNSVDFCVRSIWPHVSIGGVMIFDDYNDWGGCKAAVDEFFLGRNDYSFDNNHSLWAVKTSSTASM